MTETPADGAATGGRTGEEGDGERDVAAGPGPGTAPALRGGGRPGWRRTSAWRVAALVTGTLLAVTAAPGRSPAAQVPPEPADGVRAPLALLIGRVLDEGRDAAAGSCSAGAFRSGLCPGWRWQRVTASVRGAAEVLPDPASGPRPAAGLPTDASGPLEIVLARPGRLGEVTVRDALGRHLAGETAADGRSWANSEPLRSGETYTVRIGAENAAGTAVAATLSFDTAAADRGDRLTAEFGPRSGRYGTGQIVTAALSRPVPAADGHARVLVERALRVTSRPRVEGSWHWVDAQTLHYRPRGYWPAHAVVEVSSGLDGVELGGGLSGGPSDPVRLAIADRIEAVTDAAAHRMTVRRNGRVLRTIPVTTGKAGFLTRTGVKVVLRKEKQVRMRGDSIGIRKGTREYYDLKVKYATRVTWSGEYVHAAPWSVEAQGEENVSHGCTGMSTADAAWFFDTVREGDLVEVVNSGGEPMAPFGNGFGDWNVDWTAWLAGSALGPGGPAGPPAGAAQPAAVRLSPLA
ncbi:Ig-like domain-containing protein [Streptomyces sp. NPDC097619]|uniref:L,D-transpeptidase n=1 Tax=Streptomyces sp. NPDC097619 TaxID=3157228 RepID=UPI00331E8246